MSGYTENLKLFRQALIEATNEKTQKILDNYPGKVFFSKQHKRAMRQILNKGGKTVAVDHRRAWGRKQIIAALVAAILLMFGGLTVYAYRNEIVNFAVKVFDSFTKVQYSDSETDMPDTIEEVRVPTYVPEGYELKVYDTGLTRIQLKWENSEEKFIHFEQSIIESIYNFDNENSSFDELTIGDYRIYTVRYDQINIYLWHDGKYMYTINCSDNLLFEEISQMILSVDSE